MALKSNPSTSPLKGELSNNPNGNPPAGGLKSGNKPNPRKVPSGNVSSGEMTLKTV